MNYLLFRVLQVSDLPWFVADLIVSVFVIYVSSLFPLYIGTGKTRTILAIVSGLLASPLQRIGNAKNSFDGSLKTNSKPCWSRPRISETAAIARAWQDAALARQLNEDDQRNSNSLENSARGRVLICAQSNAAVDELVSRVSSQGLYGSDGKIYKPYLVRVGNVKTVHPNSLPFFIDTLVDQRLVEEKMNVCNEKNDLSSESSMTLRSNLEKLVDRIRFYEAKRANLRDGNVDPKNSMEDGTHKGDDGKEMSDAEIALKLRKLYEQKKQIYKDLSNVQTQEKKANEEIRALRHKLRKSILREAEIVVTTLSGSGGDLYGVCSESMSAIKFGSPSEHTLFDAVVIDEAAQVKCSYSVEFIHFIALVLLSFFYLFFGLLSIASCHCRLWNLLL